MCDNSAGVSAIAETALPDPALVRFNSYLTIGRPVWCVCVLVVWVCVCGVCVGVGVCGWVGELVCVWCVSVCVVYMCVLVCVCVCVCVSVCVYLRQC